jgi:acyl-homoserine-lactone acylase
LSNHRHYGAEIFLDDILSVCNENTHLLEACNILSNWDRQQNVNSVGAVIFNRFWEIARGLSSHYEEPFNENNPIHTPKGLTIDNDNTKNFIAESLNQAIASLSEAGIALDTKWGDAQFVMRNNQKIGIPGGAGGQGMFSVITSRFNAENGGYSPIIHGNSYIQAVTWNDDSTPKAKAMLTYSQSPEPDSAFYSDLTELYSQDHWIDLPFSEEEISADLVREEILRF